MNRRQLLIIRLKHNELKHISLLTANLNYLTHRLVIKFMSFHMLITFICTKYWDWNIKREMKFIILFKYFFVNVVYLKNEKNLKLPMNLGHWNVLNDFIMWTYLFNLFDWNKKLKFIFGHLRKKYG